MKQCRIDGWTGRIVNARRASGNDDALASGERGSRRFARRDVGIDSEVPHAARDQMAVLSSGIEDGDLGGQASFYKVRLLTRAVPMRLRNRDRQGANIC